MKTLANMFWTAFAFCFIAGVCGAISDIAQDPNFGEAANTHELAQQFREIAQDCVPIIRVSAPYDLRHSLADAEDLVRGEVRFKLVSTQADIVIHDDPSLRNRGHWGEATFAGREIWLDFEAIPAAWLGRVILHETIHSAGYWNETAGDPCDIMRVPPNQCPQGVIVRENYISALRRLGRCAGQKATLAATAPPVDGAGDGCMREED